MYIPTWLIVVILGAVVGHFLFSKKVIRWFKLWYYCWQIQAASKRGDAGAAVRWGFKAEEIGWNWDAKKWND
jgi:hypothetical protein